MTALQPIIRLPETFNAVQEAQESPIRRQQLDRAYRNALELRRQVVDDQVAENRFASPQPRQSERRMERVTVRDINRLSDEHLQQTLRPWDASDDRSPIIRLLDRIDLPRNAIANIAFGEPSMSQFLGGAAMTAGVFGGIGAIGSGLKAGAAAGVVGGPIGMATGALIGAATGLGIYGLGSFVASAVRGQIPESVRREIIANSRRADFGTPSIFFSDALERLGVENRVVRVVGGFMGDVFMDPLTYISGGGNVITRQASNGMRFTLSAPGARLYDDLARQVAQTGQIPTSGPLAEMGDFFRTSIKIGDQVYDIGGEASKLARMSEALAAARNRGDQQALRRLTGEFITAARREVVDVAQVSPLMGPVEAFRGQIARDFLRRFAAKSDHQFTFPLTGFLANRSRVALDGRTFDIPIGRFGETSRIRRQLGLDEADFVQRISTDSDKLIDGLRQTQRAITSGKFLNISGRAVAETDPIRQRAESVTRQVGDEIRETLRIPVDGMTSTEIEDLVRRGWLIDDGSVLDIGRLEDTERILRLKDARSREALQQQAKAEQVAAVIELQAAQSQERIVGRQVEEGIALADDATVEATRRRVERANERMFRANRAWREVADPVTVDFIESADNILNSLAQGDAATSMGGPLGLLKSLTPGWREHQQIRHQLHVAEREASSGARLASLQRDMRADRLQDIHPYGGSIGDTVGTLDSVALRTAETATRATEASVEARRAIRSGASGNRVRMALEPVPAPLRGNTVEHVHRVRRVEDPSDAARARGAEEVRSVAGDRNRIRIRFEDELDRLAYIATRPAARGVTEAQRVARAETRQAMEYLQRNYGLSEGGIRDLGRSIRDFAESAGGAEVTFARSDRAAWRRKMSEAGVSINFSPKRRGELFAHRAAQQTARDLERMERMAELANQQNQRYAGLSNEAKQLQEELLRLDDVVRGANESLLRATREGAQRLDEIRNSSFFRLTENLVKGQNWLRESFRIGSRLAPWRQAPARLRVQNEQEAVRRRDNFIKEVFPDELKQIKKELGVDSDQVNAAIMHRMVSQQMEAGGIPFLPNDPHWTTIENLASTESGQRLLNHPVINESARRANRTMADLWATEQLLGIAPDIAPQSSRVYIPGGMTGEASRSVRELQNRMGQQATQIGTGRLRIDQAYTRPKMTDRVLYGSKNESLILAMERGTINASEIARIGGRNSRFSYNTDEFVWAGELVKDTGRTRDFETWRQAFLAKHPELRKQGDLYDIGDSIRGVQDGERWMPPSFPSSPEFLNSQRHNYTNTVGMDVAGDVFDRDLAAVLSRRFMQHEYAKNTAKFIDEVEPMLRPIPDNRIRDMMRGRLRDTVEIEGVQYRRLKRKLLDDSLLKLPIGDDRANWFWPTALADEIEQYARRFTNENEVKGFLKATDTLVAHWKGITLLHPAWWVVNMVGGAANSFVAAGTRPSDWIRDWPRISAAVLNFHGLNGPTRQFRDSVVYQLGNVSMTEREFFEKLAAEGVMNAGRTQSEVINITRVGADAGKKYTDEISRLGGQGLGKYIGSWFRFNAATDDMWRASTVMSRMRQGDDMETAIQKAIKAHFDYSDLTFREQTVGLRVWPWYRWMRNNIALQAKLLYEKPAWIASFPKMQSALESAFEAEQQVPDELRPRWLKDSIGVQIGARPEARFLITHNLTPIQEIVEIGQALFGGGEGFLNMIRYTAGSTNPLIKAAIEVPAGRNMFTEREIGLEFGQQSITDYLTGQLRPYREYRQISRLVREDAEPLAFAMRFALGGRFVRMDDDELVVRRRREGLDTTRQLRAEIRMAVRNDDEEQARRLSNELVGKWRQLWRIGQTDMVPREMQSHFRREEAEGQ